MVIFGYIASVLIGVLLGLVGSGGSILTVPVLVYLFNVDPLLATTYSLFIVGSTSLAGVLAKLREGAVDYKTAGVFAAPSVITVLATRSFLVPYIPREVFTIGRFMVTKSILLLILFAFLMVVASVSMISGNGKEADQESRTRHIAYYRILLQGAFVGAITGLVGAGGGFLIIPALVIFSQLPMKKAVGTSLLIITVNSFTGYLGSLPHHAIDQRLLFSITILSIAGTFAGNRLGRKIAAEKLKKAFGWFVLLMGILIIIKELFFPGQNL